MEQEPEWSGQKEPKQSKWREPDLSNNSLNSRINNNNNMSSR